jgi:cobalt-zinc-cadmium efflux system outer membrane protein
MKRKNFCGLWVLRCLAVLWCVVLRGIGAEPESGAAKTNVVSLDALVAEVLERNPEVNFYKAEIAAAKGARRTAGTMANPELSSQIGVKRAQDTGTGLSGEGLAWSVSVLQTFEYPGRLALRKAIANRQIEAAQLGYEQFRAALVAKRGRPPSRCLRDRKERRQRRKLRRGLRR